MDQVQAMDQMYRYQRYIYDLSRKYYLFGRDTLIRRMAVDNGDHVLEIGCGTARNLLVLAKRHPKTHFYGLDASHEMLHTASTKIKAKGYSQQIVLKQCLAEELHYHDTFGLEKPFDKVFFSYALSMIPPWGKALEASINNLKVGGHLYIVDFYDLGYFPAWFRRLLVGWLDLFGVHYQPELLTYLQTLHEQQQGHLNLDSLKGRYAFIAHFQKN